MSKVTSSAVMQQRLAGASEFNDFPTPPWGTRTFIERGPVDFGSTLAGLVVWDPCAGRRTMSRILAEYGPARLIETDISGDYGAGVEVMDFRHAEMCDGVDWVFANPPFDQSLEFWIKAMEVARVGVAFLLRIAWLEGITRYSTIFRDRQVRYVAPYVERLPMVCGHLDKEAISATSYAWFVCLKAEVGRLPEVVHLPPSRAALEREGDYVGWPNQYRLITKDAKGNKLPRVRVVPLTDAQGNPIGDGGQIVPEWRQTDWLEALEC